MSDGRIKIRKATRKDLVDIESWLRAEEQQTGEGFFCNWSIIEDAFNDKHLVVLAANGDIVGFVVDAAQGAAIMEIRPDARGKGYGKRLAEWAMDAAFRRGNSVLGGECAPETSVPFWTKMGLIVGPNREGYGSGPYAYKVLGRRFKLRDGPRVPFQIAFYRKERNWNKTVEPFLICSGNAELLKDDSLQLPTRAICFVTEISNFADCVVRIVTNGVMLFEGKARSREANALGVSVDAGGISFVDRIFSSSSR